MAMLQPSIDEVNNSELKNFFVKALRKAPRYFWTDVASKSGKYHPIYANTFQGTVKHTATAMYVFRELATTFGIVGKSRDKGIIATGLHDTVKRGFKDTDNSRYFLYHPMYPRQYYSDLCYGKGLIDHDDYEDIMDYIETHMGCISRGSWSPGGYNIKPRTDIEKAVHLADYIASRPKLILVDFLEDYL